MKRLITALLCFSSLAFARDIIDPQQNGDVNVKRRDGSNVVETLATFKGDGTGIDFLKSFDVTGDITLTGTVDGVDVAALETNVSGFDPELKNLSTVEIQQLQNIDSSTISSAQ